MDWVNIHNHLETNTASRKGKYMKNKKLVGQFENARKSMAQTLIAEILTYLPIAVCLLVIFLFGSLYKLKAAGVGFIISGISGIIVAIRKESPRFYGGIQGRKAVFYGMLWWLLTWVAGFYLLFGE
jgi:hypothetical protein